MKILYVVGDPGSRINKYVSTGRTTHIVSMIKAFRQLGCDVVPLIVGGNTKERKSDASYGKLKNILPHPIALVLRDIYKTLYSFKFYSCYKLDIEKIAPDLIYERYCHFHFGCSLIAKELKIPYIVEVNSPPDAIKLRDPGYLLSIARLVHKFVVNQADAVITVSDKIRLYLEKVGVSTKKIFVLPNGADCELFNSRNYRGDNMRKEFNLTNKLIIGFVGTMKKYHGLNFLVQIAQNVVNIRNNVHFLLVGPTNDLESFKHLITEKNLSNCFTLTGGVPFNKVPKYISAMDICVMPHSNLHGSPIKISEYGAMGKAVVAPRFEPIEEIIDDGMNGLLFAPNNLKDAVRKIKILLSTPSLRTKFGKNLRKKIINNYTWKKNAENVLGIYEAIRR